MKIIHLSDIHCNFMPAKQRLKFYSEIKERQPDCIVITGDIGEASTFPFFLKELHNHTERKIYFVLGNHDFYRSFVKDTMAKIEEQEGISFIHNKMIPLTEKTSLCGINGWADGRYGDYDNSKIKLNDHRLIYDFLGMSKFEILSLMRKFADEDATNLKHLLSYSQNEIIIATHVPPYCEEINDYSPFFASKIMGRTIDEVVVNHPEKKIKILTGHTHRGGIFKKDNIEMVVSASDYQKPVIDEHEVE